MISKNILSDSKVLLVLLCVDVMIRIILNHLTIHRLYQYIICHLTNVSARVYAILKP